MNLLKNLMITSVLLAGRETMVVEEAKADDEDEAKDEDEEPFEVVGIVAGIIGQAGSIRLMRTSRS